MTGHAMGGMPVVTAGAGTLSVVALWAAFLLGLVGGFTHCLAMCGPLVAAASLTDGASSSCSEQAARRGTRFQLWFHAGRLLTYALIGALLGLAGLHRVTRSLAGPLGSAPLAAGLRVAAGIAIVAAGVWLVAAPMLGRSGRLPEPTAWLASRRWFAHAAARLSRARWGLPFGMLMALLPCAPLLPAEAAALASGSAPSGVAVMLAFGVGTVPAMVGAGAFGGLIGAGGRAKLAPVAGALTIALGLVIIAQAATLVSWPAG